MKTVEFFKTTTGYIGEVNKESTWLIRHEPNAEQNNNWYVYKSEDGGKSHKLIPAECTRDENGYVDFDKHYVYGFENLKAAKAFIYHKEIA